MITNGRPEYPEEQYRQWFDDLAPFFKLGETLNSAIEDAGLQKHRTTLYEKVRLNDWFSHRMETLQAMPGKLANNILIKRLMIVNDKIRQGQPISADEMKDVRFIAEKHRSSQPYFVNRQEITKTDPDKVNELIGELDLEDENIDDVAEHARTELYKHLN